MSYTPVVPRDFFDSSEPDEPSVAWLDGEGSIICAYCAVGSDSEDEVPQFRPVTPVETFIEDERCDQCSRVLAEVV